MADVDPGIGGAGLLVGGVPWGELLHGVVR
jgi:hypothetical protein